MRELSLKAISLMDGQKVKVKDIANDVYDQICEVKVKKEPLRIVPNMKPKEVVTGITLENEEFLFEYDLLTGKCINGEFKVYSLK